VKDIVVVHAVPEDRIGDGIWGLFSTYKKAKRALKAAGLRVWDPHAHNADDPVNETPREPDERVVGFTALDYRLKRKGP